MTTPADTRDPPAPDKPKTRSVLVQTPEGVWVILTPHPSLRGMWQQAGATSFATEREARDYARRKMIGLPVAAAPPPLVAPAPRQTQSLFQSQLTISMRLTPRRLRALEILAEAADANGIIEMSGDTLGARLSPQRPDSQQGYHHLRDLSAMGLIAKLSPGVYRLMRQPQEAAAATAPTGSPLNLRLLEDLPTLFAEYPKGISAATLQARYPEASYDQIADACRWLHRAGHAQWVYTNGTQKSLLPLLFAEGEPQLDVTHLQMRVLRALTRLPRNHQGETPASYREISDAADRPLAPGSVHLGLSGLQDRGYIAIVRAGDNAGKSIIKLSERAFKVVASNPHPTADMDATEAEAQDGDTSAEFAPEEIDERFDAVLRAAADNGTEGKKPSGHRRKGQP